MSLNPTLLLFLSLTQIWMYLDFRYVLGFRSSDAELQKLLLLFRLCQAPTCWILCYTLIFLWAENSVRFLGIAALKGLEFRQCSWQVPTGLVLNSPEADALNCTLKSHLIGTQVCLFASSHQWNDEVWISHQFMESSARRKWVNW